MEFDRIDVSEGIDINKTDLSCECIICHYWYFLRINSRFQPKVCDGCHDVTLRSITFDDFAIVTVKRNYHRINFWLITKGEAVDKC